MDHKPTTTPEETGRSRHNAKRADLVRDQVTELLTKYGKIDLHLVRWRQRRNHQQRGAQTPARHRHQRTQWRRWRLRRQRGRAPRQAVSPAGLKPAPPAGRAKNGPTPRNTASTTPRWRSPSSSCSAPGAATCSPTSAPRATAARPNKPMPAGRTWRNGWRTAASR